MAGTQQGAGSRRVHSAAGDEIASRKPVLVVRYRGFTRLNHWITAGCMILLLLSNPTPHAGQVSLKKRLCATR